MVPHAAVSTDSWWPLPGGAGGTWVILHPPVTVLLHRGEFGGQHSINSHFK